MIILDEAHNIAVHLTKSENMRATAGKLFACAKDYVYAADSDGAEQLIRVGYEPNQNGLWRAVTADPSYPANLGKSFSTGERLLRIGKAPDPEIAAQAERDRQNAEPARSASRQEVYRQRGETLQEDFDPIGDELSTDVIKPDPSPVLSAKRAIACCTTEQTMEFAVWFVDHMHTLGLDMPRHSVDKVSTKLSSPRVGRAVALFFELPAPKHLWVKQRMAEAPIQTFRNIGPHVEWVQTFWQCSKEEQDAIREQIKIAEQRNAA